ncbi:HAD family hydrolase [Candidatus Sumerlaeota bacterium]|nr:HAD family hydrolase [Candidatus Sumerlaeota bacterium]
MPPSSLLVFDIDGTLVTMDEERAFAEAFEETTGERPHMDWKRYRSCTDWGVAVELLENHLGRNPTEAEVRAALDLFVSHLRRRIADGSTPITPVPGVVDFVRGALRDGCAVSLATGCVEISARTKIEAIGLGDVLSDGGFGDLRFDRESLLRDGIAAAERQHGAVFPPERICYFGDRTWDAEGARALGIHFIGVGFRPGAREELEGVGVTRIIDGYGEIASPRECFAP